MTNIWRNAGSKDTKKMRNDTKTILDPYVGEALSISGSNVYIHVEFTHHLQTSFRMGNHRFPNSICRGPQRHLVWFVYWASFLLVLIIGQVDQPAGMARSEPVHARKFHKSRIDIPQTFVLFYWDLHEIQNHRMEWGSKF